MRHANTEPEQVDRLSSSTARIWGPRIGSAATSLAIAGVAAPFIAGTFGAALEVKPAPGISVVAEATAWVPDSIIDGENIAGREVGQLISDVTAPLTDEISRRIDNSVFGDRPGPQDLPGAVRP